MDTFRRFLFGARRALRGILLTPLLLVAPVALATEGTDVGSVGVPGSDGLTASGAIQVTGSGADIWGVADAFHFRSSALAGDGALVARVTSVSDSTSSYPWAKAGVMFREDLSAGAREVMLLLTPAGKIGLQVRSASGGDTTFIDGGAGTAGLWLMLDRHGNEFHAYQSTDGNQWSPVAAATVAMAAGVRGGLAVTSHDNTRTMTATFQDYDEVGFGMPTSTAGWTGVDIGSAGVTGTTSDNGSQVTLTTASGDIWEQADSCRYYYRAWTGDGSITAHVGSITPTHQWAKAGVMIRVGLQPDAANVAMVLTSANACGLQRRATPGALTEFTAGAWVNPPYWVRLTRTGSHFQGFVSADGNAWTSVGAYDVAMGDQVYLGLVASAHDVTKTATAVFDQVTVPTVTTTTPPNAPSNLYATATSATAVHLNWTDNSGDETGFEIARSTAGGATVVVIPVGPNTVAYDDTGLAPNTYYSYTVRAVRDGVPSLNAPAFSVSTPPENPSGGTWQGADIGNVGVAGTTTDSGGTIMMSAGGADIWGAADGFSYFYRSMTGDGTVIARVAGLANTHPWAKAGVMMRQNLQPGSPNVAMLMTAAAAISLQSRATAGGDTTVVAGPWYTAPYWVKLVRAGNDFTASYSPDGVGWTVLGTQTVTMGAEILVGLAACAHSTTTATTATFDHITLPGGTTDPNQTPPAAPADLRYAAAATAHSIPLAWYDNANDETGYEIERATGYATQGFAVIAALPANTTTFTDTGLAASTTYTYRVRAVRNGVYSAYANTFYGLTDLERDTPWTEEDIGTVAVPGSSSDSNGTITVTGSGTALLESTADSGHFRERVVYNDAFTLTARVTGLTGADPGARAGLMFREYSWESAAAGGLFITRAGQVVLASRYQTGAYPLPLSATGPTLATPVWLRVVRSFGSVLGYWSPDGQTWTLVGSLANYGSVYHVGLAVTAHSTSGTATATFDNVVLGPPPPNGSLLPPTNLVATATAPTRVDLTWSDNTTQESGFSVERSTDGVNFSAATTGNVTAASYVDSGLAASTTYWYRVRALSASASSEYSSVLAVTTPAAPPWQTALWNTTGQLATTATTETITAGGADIWGTSDGGLFAYQPWTGDGEVILKVDSFTNTDGWAKAGIMFRAATDSAAANVFLALTPQVGVVLQSRATAGAASVLNRQDVNVAPVNWLKLVRVGSTFTGYWSRDGVAWTMLGGGQTIALPSTVYVGLAVSAHSTSASTTVQFTKFSVK